MNLTCNNKEMELAPMQILALLSRLSEQDVELKLLDGQLKVSAAKGALSTIQMHDLKVHKAQLIAEFEHLGIQSNLALETLTYSQQRLWLLDQIDRRHGQYNIAEALKVKGPFNIEALSKAFTTLLERHQSLRTVYRTMLDGEPVQLVMPLKQMPLSMVDLQGLDHASQELRVEQTSADEAVAPFDLSRDLMLRVKLLRLDPEYHVMFITLHHIASDGWSMNLLVKELRILYNHYLTANDNPLAPLPLQFADYARWQRKWLTGQLLEQYVQHWRNDLAGAPQLHNLPTDRQRPANLSHVAGIYQSSLDTELTTGLNRLAQGAGASLFMVLHAAFAVWMSRMSGVRDVVVGTPIANRDRPELESLVGFFVNTLALRTELSEGVDFLSLVDQSKKRLLSAYEYQHIPFDKLVDELNPTRGIGYNPLFQVMLSLHNNHDVNSEGLQLNGVQLSRLVKSHTVAQFDLVLDMLETEQGLMLNWVYAVDLFNQSSLVNMAECFVQLCQQLLTHPQTAVDKLPMVVQSENQTLVTPNEVAETIGVRVEHLFALQAAASPDTIAVSCDDGQFSYAELDSSANRLARLLLVRGFAAEARVAICMDRSFVQVCSVLAVLKAGLAFLPIDPSYPQSYIQFMLEDAEVVAVLTSEHLQQEIDFCGRPVIALDNELLQRFDDSAPLNSELNAEQLAYVLYTSGSTGQPKGVMVEHAKLNQYLSFTRCSYWNQYRPTRAIMSSSLSFNATFTPFFSALLNGGTLHILGNDSRIIEALAEQMRQSEVSLFKLTPSHLMALGQYCGEDILSEQPHLLIIGGEALASELLFSWQKRLPQASFINEYGATETVVGCTYEVSSSQQDHPLVPIGLPLGNTRVYVLNSSAQQQPPNVVGELYIGGGAVTRGYLNQPQKTHESFVEGETLGLAPGRLYRTGDLVRQLLDGRLLFVGRADNQIKISGHRIEPHEITDVARRYPGVSDAAVVLDQQLQGLVLYLIAPKTLSRSAVQQFLQLHLAHYMQPAAIMVIDEFPLNSNGKLDLKSLPPLDRESRFALNYEVPQGKIECELAELWQQLLQVDKVGRQDNFFDIGGNSMLATLLFWDIRQRWNINLEIRQIFQTPTLALLAEFVTEQCQLAGLAEVAIGADSEVWEI